MVAMRLGCSRLRGRALVAPAGDNRDGRARALSPDERSRAGMIP